MATFSPPLTPVLAFARSPRTSPELQEWPSPVFVPALTIPPEPCISNKVMSLVVVSYNCAVPAVLIGPSLCTP